MEAASKRLERFLRGGPDEIFLTILNSLHNFLIPEIRRAMEEGLVDLAMIGAHGVAQTISEHIYGRRGVDATHFYLDRFVDSDRPDLKFSEIAPELHGYRNVAAHRWSSISSHALVFDSTLDVGWRRTDDGVRFNPKIFIDSFVDGFRTLSPMWDPVALLGELESRCAMYRYLARWLELDKGDDLNALIVVLCSQKSRAEFDKHEANVVAAIVERYGLEL